MPAADYDRDEYAANSELQSHEVLKLQMSRSPYAQRDAYTSVQMQPLVAQNTHFKSSRPRHHADDLREAYAFLEQVSAAELPPAFAAFAGMGSSPFC